MRTLLRSLVTLVIVALALVAGLWLWHYYLYTPWTRDGRVGAEIITVASDLSGRVVSPAPASISSTPPSRRRSAAMCSTCSWPRATM